MKKLFPILFLIVFTSPLTVFAHGVGRLFDVAVMNGQLVARGYNSGSPDGLGTIRPFVNSIHDHFNFIGSEAEPFGITNYPSLDIGILSDSNIDALIGYELRIELVGSAKWINVPAQDGTGAAQDFGTPQLISLTPQDLQNSPADVMRVRYSGETIDTVNLGEFLLSPSVAGPTPDLDFEFFIDNHNSSEIYIFEFRLKTNAPGIADSEKIYVIQSPDGIGPVERMHFQSLYLESYLGLPTPKAIVPGDVNLDGQANLLDVQPFVSLINRGVYQVEADMNEDGSVDLLDVNEFVVAISSS